MQQGGMETEQNYTGLALGDKKALKEAAVSHNPVDAQAKLKAKLGPEWIFVVDWASLIANVKAKGSGEEKQMACVYTKWLPIFVAEVETYDDSMVSGLNAAVPVKAWTLRGGAKGDDFKNGGGRYNVAVGANGVVVSVNPDGYVFNGGCSYPYDNKTTVAEFISRNCAGTDDKYPGLSLGEKKKTAELEAKAPFATSEAKLKAALGSDWTFNIEWATIIKGMREAQPDNIQWIGMVYTATLPTFLKEIEAMDADVKEALNEACKKHVWTVTYGKKGEDFNNGGGRYRIEPLANGVTIVWSPSASFFSGNDSQYPYDKKTTVTAFALANC